MPVSNTTVMVDDDVNPPAAEGVSPIVQFPTEPEFNRAGVNVTPVPAVAAVIVMELGLTTEPSEDVDTPKPDEYVAAVAFVMLVRVSVPVAEAASAHVSPSVTVTVCPDTAAEASVQMPVNDPDSEGTTLEGMVKPAGNVTVIVDVLVKAPVAEVVKPTCHGVVTLAV